MKLCWWFWRKLVHSKAWNFFLHAICKLEMVSVAKVVLFWSTHPCSVYSFRRTTLAREVSSKCSVCINVSPDYRFQSLLHTGDIKNIFRPGINNTNAHTFNCQSCLPEGLFRDVSLRSEACDGPHPDLDSLVQLFASHIPHSLVWYNLRFGLQDKQNFYRLNHPHKSADYMTLKLSHGFCLDLHLPCHHIVVLGPAALALEPQSSGSELIFQTSEGSGHCWNRLSAPSCWFPFLCQEPIWQLPEKQHNRLKLADLGNVAELVAFSFFFSESIFFFFLNHTQTVPWS